MCNQTGLKGNKEVIKEVKVKVEPNESLDSLTTTKNKRGQSKRLGKKKEDIDKEREKDVGGEDDLTDITDESSSHSDMKRLARVRKQIWNKRMQSQKKQAVNMEEDSSWNSDSERSEVKQSGFDLTSVSTSENSEKLKTPKTKRNIAEVSLLSDSDESTHTGSVVATRKRAKKTRRGEDKGKKEEQNTSKRLAVEKYGKLLEVNQTRYDYNYYSLRFRALKTGKDSEVHFVTMEFSNHVGQLNIYMKADLILDTLKDICKHANYKFKNTDLFAGVIENGRVAEMRDLPRGPNKYRFTTYNGREYKVMLNYFLIPKKIGSLERAAEAFKRLIVSMVSSDDFYGIMLTHVSKRPNSGGGIGTMLRKEPLPPCWVQLQDKNNHKLEYITTLDFRLMDDEIYSVLDSMFPGRGNLNKYKTFGWSQVCESVEKSKKK